MPYPPGVPGLPGEPLRADPFAPDPFPAARRRFRSRPGIHLLLFVLTVATTTIAGAWHYLSFVSDFGRVPVASPDQVFVNPALLLPGLWYSASLLAILGAHEMGHYVFCRVYRVDASWPYFLPAPLPLTGTLGAVIRIRQAFPTRTILFDIGVAGPIAGFAVLVPLLFWGMSLSQITLAPTEIAGWELGEPLLFRWAASLTFGDLPAGHTINMHPMVFAAWFGLLATALNLLPFGQLDGGHITYATLGRWSTPISIATVVTAIVMTFISLSWLVMTLLMVLMLIILGPRHPHVLYPDEPLGPGRKALALLALFILLVSFTPAPMTPLELIGTP